MVDVLDATAPEQRVGVGRDVARGVHVGDAGAQVVVDDDAVVDLEAGGLGQGRTREHAHADDGCVGRDVGAVVEPDPYAVAGVLAALDRAVHDRHTAVGEGLGQAGGERAREHLLLHVLLVEHEGDGDVVLHERGGDLRADVATADDGDVAALLGDRAQPLVVGGGAVVDDPRAGVEREHPRLGAGGQQELAVADAAAVGEAYGVGVGVDRRHGRVGDEVDVVVVLQVTGERVALERGVVLEPQVFGQGGTVDGLGGLGADDGDAAALVLRPDAGDRTGGRDTSTDDDVVVGILELAHASHRAPGLVVRGCAALPSRRRGWWRCRPGSGRRRRCAAAARRGRPCAGRS